MRIRHRIVTVALMPVLAFFLLPPAHLHADPQTAQKSKPSLIVFNLIPERGIDPGLANLLTEVVIDGVSSTERFKVTGQKDVDKLLSWEQSKQLSGCTDTRCLVQLAGALGAAYYVEGSLGKIGTSYLLTLKLMDAVNVTVLKRSTEEVAGSEDSLVKVLKKMIAAVMEQDDGTQTVKTAKPKPSDRRTTYESADNDSPAPDKVEWFSLRFVGGDYGAGAAISFFTLKWKYFYLEVLRGEFALKGTGLTETDRGAGSVGVPGYGVAGTSFGVPIMLDGSGVHELRIGTGIFGGDMGYGQGTPSASDKRDTVFSWGPFILAEVYYIWHVVKYLGIQVGFEVLIPTLEACEGSSCHGIPDPALNGFIGLRI